VVRDEALEILGSHAATVVRKHERQTGRLARVLGLLGLLLGLFAVRMAAGAAGTRSSRSRRNLDDGNGDADGRLVLAGRAQRVVDELTASLCDALGRPLARVLRREARKGA
jgi:hypothetical protein